MLMIPLSEAGAEYQYLQGAHRKDKLVDKLLRQRPISEGLICVLCCMECCPSFKLAHAKDRPRLVNTRRPQRVLYFYFLDADLGLIHIRLTTWFPFSVQIYVHGHSWLAQQMLKRRLGFTQQDNAFTGSSAGTTRTRSKTDRSPVSTATNYCTSAGWGSDATRPSRSSYISTGRPQCATTGWHPRSMC